MYMSSIYTDMYMYMYRGWPKKGGHRQKYSQFGITVTRRTEMKENRTNWMI